ncbi:gamma-glutamyl-gamma-aminobutyrate hydrolase family protein [Streptomyces sp. NPDC127068]|uniref:gamma-glutamyl-gamma-aminobutyrate hydrolase family protein n=1 Tax=Streptomyces sp. NPDC127068 TaxID=3347127 RepID=UPI00364F89F9
MRPLIAVAGTARVRMRDFRHGAVAAPSAVLEAVLRAGGDPVVLMPAAPPLGSLLARFDGLVLPGGADLRLGRGERSGATEPEDRLQDLFDMALARLAVRQGMPLLAACRGMQALNVALGGSLTSCAAHGGRRGSIMEEVELQTGCRIARITGRTSLAVADHPAPAVERLGAGLRTTGRGRTGVIQALEHVSTPVLAVRWHPEDNAERTAEQQALFDAHTALADLARRGRRSGPVGDPCSPLAR